MQKEPQSGGSCRTLTALLRAHGRLPTLEQYPLVTPSVGGPMTVAADPSPAFSAFAHPERLVSTEWLAEHLGEPGLVVVESDEDVLLYETGHIEGAVKIDWHTDLNDPVTRDYIDGAGFAKLVGSKGISRDSTVVIYGDKNNWWAAYALWVFTLFGHEDVRLLDGGRAKWGGRGPRVHDRCPDAGRRGLPRRRARRQRAARVQGRRARRDRHRPARRRPLPRGVRRRPHHRPRVSRGVRRCAPATSRQRATCRGRGPWPRTARSSPPTS